jgi:hypothetical protein
VVGCSIRWDKESFSVSKPTFSKISLKANPMLGPSMYAYVAQYCVAMATTTTAATTRLSRQRQDRGRAHRLTHSKGQRTRGREWRFGWEGGQLNDEEWWRLHLRFADSSGCVCCVGSEVLCRAQAVRGVAAVDELLVLAVTINTTETICLDCCTSSE